MSPIGAVHLTFSLVAIATGAVVLALPKGTRWHRTWGHGYAWSMVGVVATSFSMYDLLGGFSPFHFAALIAGVAIIGGMWAVLGRRPKRQWVEAHATWMAWSYVGLMAAFVAESLTRFVMPVLSGVLERNSLWPAFWGLVFVGTFAAIGIGSRLIKKLLPGALARTPQAIRDDQKTLALADSGPPTERASTSV